MAFRPDLLLAHDFGTICQRYSSRDAILYALGVGLGRDPVDHRDLAFLDERRLQVLPTFGVTLASPGMWIKDPKFGVDFASLLHVEQHAIFVSPLPPEAEVLGDARVISITDRGAERGAVLVLERHVKDAGSGTLYTTTRQTLLLRGNGGFNGLAPERAASCIPNRPHDLENHFTVSRRAALIYRLSGDWNPLHLDPAFAIQAGFERPILHGLASYAAAAYEACRVAAFNPLELQSLTCRFTGFILPGDQVRLSLWVVPQGIMFEAFVGDRRVLSEGAITFKEG